MKEKMRSCVAGCIFAAVAITLIGCGGERVVVVPSPAAAVVPATVTPAAPVVATVPATPPPPEDIVAGVSPGADYLWVKGYYNWDGSRYEWVPGSWVRTPRESTVWVPAHWQPSSGGYVWVPGSWR